MTIHAPERTSFAVRLDSVSKAYGTGESAVLALDNVSIAMPRGTQVSMMNRNSACKHVPLPELGKEAFERPAFGQVVAVGAVASPD